MWKKKTNDFAATLAICCIKNSCHLQQKMNVAQAIVCCKKNSCNFQQTIAIMLELFVA